MKFISLNPDIIKNVMKIRDWVNTENNPIKLYIQPHNIIFPYIYNGKLKYRYASDNINGYYKYKYDYEIIDNNNLNIKYINLCNKALLKYILRYFSYLSSDYRLNDNMIIQQIYYNQYEFDFPIEISYIFIRKNNMFKHLYYGLKSDSGFDDDVLTYTYVFPKKFSSSFHKCITIKKFYTTKNNDNNDSIELSPYHTGNIFGIYLNRSNSELDDLTNVLVFNVSRKYFI